jgi:hypothetical protein
VTIAGANFATGATVSFDGNPAMSVVVVSAAQITCVTPAGSGTVDVVVTNPASQIGTLSNGFTYYAQPTVTSVSPNVGSGAGGTPVTIAGTNFATGVTVRFGASTALAIVRVDATTITCTTPAGSGTVTVAVENLGSQIGTLAGAFTYYPTPSIGSISPNAGEAGDAVTITGTGFVSGVTVEFDTVEFGTVPAGSVVRVSSTEITCVVPAGSGQADVTVENPASLSDTEPNAFTYQALTLTDPTGGESWVIGSVHDITWTGAGIAAVKIDVSVDGGTSWVTLVLSHGTGSPYQWTVAGTPSADCRIRISDASDTSPEDVSSGAFSIPGISLTAPVGTETLVVGESFDVRWAAIGVTAVKIELSRDGNWTNGDGSDVESIAASVDATDASYLWTVTEPTSATCAVRVTDTANATVYDESPATLEIVGMLSFLGGGCGAAAATGGASIVLALVGVALAVRRRRGQSEE